MKTNQSSASNIIAKNETVEKNVTSSFTMKNIFGYSSTTSDNNRVNEDWRTNKPHKSYLFGGIFQSVMFF